MSDVSAVAKNDVVTIAAIKSDNVLYTNYWSLAGNTFDKWYQWKQLPGATFPTSKRVALVQPSGSDVQAFGMRTSDSLMVTAKRTGVASWAGWTTVQNNAQFPAQNVAAGVQGTNVHVFAQRSDNRLYYNLQTGSSWAGFFAIGSPSNAFPLDNEIAVGQRTSNQLDVFMRGFDGRLYSTYSNPAHIWAGWGVMGDSWNMTPNGGGIALAPRNANQLQFFTVGFDNHVWTSNWESGVTNWTTWASMGDPPTN